MKHLFLDTNILIDFLADRKPISLEAARLFNFSFKKKVILYVSAVSYNNIYYLLRQSKGHVQTIKILHELLEWTEMVDISKEVILHSLKSEFKDFEDSIQYNCAKRITKIDCIVSRNAKDFKLSSVPNMTPKEALTMIEGSSR